MKIKEIFTSKNTLEKEKNIQEKEKKVQEIKNFFTKKANEFHGRAFGGPDNYRRPYAKGLTDVDFGEALREFEFGKKYRVIHILDSMISEAIGIDPSWPDIKLMKKLRSYVDEV